MEIPCLWRKEVKTVPLLGWNHMLSRSLSVSDVSLPVFAFVCQSSPSFFSLLCLSFYCFALPQTCLLTQQIQMTTSCFIYISCPIPEPSIFNRTRSLLYLTLPLHRLFSLPLSDVHSPSNSPAPYTLLSFMLYLCLFSPLSIPVICMPASPIFPRPNNVHAYACEWQEMPVSFDLLLCQVTLSGCVTLFT